MNSVHLKSHISKRFKSLLKIRPYFERVVGLTGTPSSNGLMDLWAEFRVLDFRRKAWSLYNAL